MKLLGIRPAREAGDRVELAKELADQLFAIILRAQLVDSTEHARERRLVNRQELSKPDGPLLVPCDSSRGSFGWVN